MSGRLIVFEGLDGSGKSTQARRLAERLGALLTRQMGGTEIGSDLRAVILDPSRSLDDRAEALLVLADRAQHVAEVVAPALQRGETVVSDRFSASTLAYQGYGRGLDLGLLAELNRFATGGLAPGLTVLLDIGPECAGARLGGSADRIEGAGAEFHAKVRQGYLELAAADPEAWAVIDGDAPPATVAERVDAAVDAFLAKAEQPARSSRSEQPSQSANPEELP